MRLNSPALKHKTQQYNKIGRNIFSTALDNNVATIKIYQSYCVGWSQDISS